MKSIEFLKITKELNIKPDSYALMTAGDLLKGTAGAETQTKITCTTSLVSS